MSANETQVGGTHYTDMAVQPWDAMRAWMTPDQFCGYLLGTAVAYLARVNVAAPGKGGIDDIEKARHVLAKLAETWHYRIFREFPKEVMQTGSVQSGRPGSSEQAADDSPVDPPAVSASAAGDWPGPDWSQAPEWATAWAIDQDGVASWFNGPTVALNPIGSATGDGYWFDGSPSLPAPSFNYPGHWRDSLRRRPA